jgi:hypothetical protein
MLPKGYILRRHYITFQEPYRTINTEIRQETNLGTHHFKTYYRMHTSISFCNVACRTACNDHTMKYKVYNLKCNPNYNNVCKLTGAINIIRQIIE